MAGEPKKLRCLDIYLDLTLLEATMIKTFGDTVVETLSPKTVAALALARYQYSQIWFSRQEQLFI